MPTLGSHPEAFLAAERIHMLFQFAGGLFRRQDALFDQLVIDPAGTGTVRAASGGGHHATLIVRNDHNRLIIATQNDRVRVLFQKFRVLAKCLVGHGRILLEGVAIYGGQR